MYSALIELYPTLAARIKYPVLLRRKTTDRLVFRGVFIKKDLKLPVAIQPKFIIDGGAYTGITAVWYSSQYPDSKIIAVEPDASSFAMLRKNTKKLPNVTCVQAGLWKTEGFLTMVDLGLGEWGGITREAHEESQNTVPAVTINSLLEKSEFDIIDCVKLDIEGAESEVFSENLQWIDKTNVIAVELHDKKPEFQGKLNKECGEILEKIMDPRVWDTHFSHEKHMFIRKTFLTHRDNKN